MRRDHVAELFNRAVGQLEDEKLHVRLGAVLTLRQIARDCPDLTTPTLDLLSVDLRERRPQPGEEVAPAEIREIMASLNERLR